MTPRSNALLIATLLVSFVTIGCTKNIEESSAYQAACHGPPLRTGALRNKAMEDGYDVNRQYDCIDKASFGEVNDQRVKWEAANTPEAIAERAAAFAEKKARYDEQRAREVAAEDIPTKVVLPNIDLRNVDVNSATEADIASVISVGPVVAAQIIKERDKRRFNDWTDLVNRVIGLGAAQTAAYASICGLSVDGKSLDGAPPNVTIAASIYQKYQQHQK